MLDIKKKIIAIMTICAMAVSMSACSDDGEEKDGKTADGIQVATLTPEEATEMMQDKFEIVEFTEGDASELGQEQGGAVAQDPVEQDPVEQTPQDSQNAQDSQENNNPIVDDNGEVVDSVDLQISAVDSNAGNADNNNAQGGNNSAGNNADVNNNNNSNEAGNNALVEGTGAKKIQQAFWMNLNGDYIFDGEFITATFKIKETTPNGTYPITLEWLDFANIKAVSLDDVTGVDGSVVVGGAAESNAFTDGFQVKADCVSGNPGDEVTVTFQMKNNPGICACVFRFGYDSDALEYVGGDKGADFLNALETQNQ